MRNLLVISNHNPSSWDSAQLEGWDNIIYTPFPYIDPFKGFNELKHEIYFIRNEINNFVKKCEAEGNTPYICLQGEFWVCYNVFVAYCNDISIKFVFPSTERREGGKFEFVRWR